MTVAKRISLTALIPIEEVFSNWKNGLFWWSRTGGEKRKSATHAEEKRSKNEGAQRVMIFRIELTD